MTIPRSLCIAGPDGAGKTTQATRLAGYWTARGLAVTVCTIWDMLGGGGIPFKDKAQIDAFLGDMHAPGRALFLHMAMREALDRATEVHLGNGEAGRLIVVGSWYKYNATERAYGGDPALLDALAASFPRLEAGVWLDVPPAVALDRKGDVSSYESAGRGRAGFLAFQERVRPIADALRGHDGMPWHVVDGTAAEEVVARAIRAAAGA